MRTTAGAYMRKNARHKHAAILKAAGRLFMKHGYTHTSMDAIAMAAGVSKQTVYSYFTNKELLFRCMIEELCNSYTPSEKLLEDPNLPTQEALLKIAHGFMDTISSTIGLGIHRLAISEAPRHYRVAELFYESGPNKIQNLLTRYLERQTAAGYLRIDDIEMAANYFFGMLKSWHQLRMLLKLKPVLTKREMERHVEKTVSAFCRLYGIDGTC